MIQLQKWIERSFKFNFPIAVFPAILERFRGTPARLEELISTIPEKILTIKIDNKWSVQEHAGHLSDLEKLGEKRIEDFLSGAEYLSPADVTNKATTEAGYNSREIKVILKEFREARKNIVQKLEILNQEQISVSAIHPRLNIPMRVIDWVFFMSEHDDHHLASIRMISQKYKEGI